MSGRAARELIDALFEQAGVGLCLAAPDGTVIRANETWRRAAGLPAEQVAERAALAPFPAWRHVVRGLDAGGEAGGPVPLPPLRRAGVTWHASVVPVHAGDGERLLFTLREAPEEAGAREGAASPAERRPETRPRARRDAHPTFRALAEAMPQIVCSLAPDGTPEYVNPAWTAYSGLDLPASVADGWLGVVHPDDAPALRDCWRRATASGAPEQVELRYRAADGAYRWFLCRLAPIEDAQGRVVRWIGAGIDIDDRQAGRGASASGCSRASRRRTAGRTSSSPCSPTSCATRSRRSGTASYILEHAPRRAASRRARAAAVIERQVGPPRAARRRPARRHAHRARQDPAPARAPRPRRARRGGRARTTARCSRRAASRCGARRRPRPVWVDADATRLAQVIGNLLAERGEVHARAAGPRRRVSLGAGGRHARAPRARHRRRDGARTCSRASSSRSSQADGTLDRDAAAASGSGSRS